MNGEKITKAELEKKLAESQSKLATDLLSQFTLSSPGRPPAAVIT